MIFNDRRSRPAYSYFARRCYLLETCKRTSDTFAGPTIYFRYFVANQLSRDLTGRYRGTRALFTRLDPRWSTSLLGKLIYRSRARCYTYTTSTTTTTTTTRRRRMAGLAYGDTAVEAEGYIYVSSLDTKSVKRSVYVSSQHLYPGKKLVQWDYPEAGKCLAVEGKWLLDWYEPPLVQRFTMSSGSPDIVKSGIFAVRYGSPGFLLEKKSRIFVVVVSDVLLAMIDRLTIDRLDQVCPTRSPRFMTKIGIIEWEFYFNHE